MSKDNEQDVLRELGRIIGQNADWLSGRDFQRLALHAAQGYFPAEDLDQLCRPVDFINAMRKELELPLVATLAPSHVQEG